MAEYNGSGTLLRKYIYGPGLDEPIMMIVPGDTSETVYYYHADAQGTIIGLTNDTGAWVEKYAYTLYGKPAAASTVGNPYMYTGRRLDAETGLYYYRARYYDPHLRRFIETDPIGYAGGMNLYAYVGNSPVNWIDPWGSSAIAVAYPIAVGAAAGAAGGAFFTGVGAGSAIAAVVIIPVGFVLGTPSEVADGMIPPSVMEEMLKNAKSTHLEDNPNTCYKKRTRREKNEAKPTTNRSGRERNVGHPEEVEHNKVNRGKSGNYNGGRRP